MDGSERMAGHWISYRSFLSCVDMAWQMPPAHARNTCNFTCVTTTTASDICLGNENIKQDRRKNTANEVNDWKIAPVEEAGVAACSMMGEKLTTHYLMERNSYDFALE